MRKSSLPKWADQRGTPLPSLRARLIQIFLGVLLMALLINALAAWLIFAWFRAPAGLEFTAPLALLRAALPSLSWFLLSALAVGILAALVIGWFVARLTSPLKRFAEDTQKFDQLPAEVRAASYSIEEYQRLAEAFNHFAHRLQASQKELREFVAQASHELRTPLTAVKLRAEALNTGALNNPEVAQRFLREIEEEIDRLSRMVNDLLDLSRLESGAEVSRRTLLNFGTIVTEVSEDFAVRAERAGVNLHVWVQPDLPPIHADEDQLWRVLVNLLDNAFHFTPPGGRIDLRAGYDHHRGVVHFEIQDSGTGIAPEDLPHIFKPFYRTQSTRQRSTRSAGSGLGLAICKTIIEQHGGRIGADSHLGQGSTFWFDLPAVSAPSKQAGVSP